MPLRCEACNKGFGSATALKQHREDTGHIHSASTSRTSSSSFVHVTRPDDGGSSATEDDDPTCAQCSKRFASIEALAQHVRDSPVHRKPSTASDGGVALNGHHTIRSTTQSNVDSPLDDFFASFAGFSISDNPNANLGKAFGRLKKHVGVVGDKSGPLKKRYSQALVAEFNARFAGGGDTDLGAWQRFCELVGVQPVPGTITKCKKELRLVHVNLIDLVEAARAGRKPKVFRTVAKLRDYTANSGKFFPKETAKGSKLLKFMLRELIA